MAGQRWLVREVGSYFPSVDEEIVQVHRAHILTDKKAIKLRATRSFKDVYGVDRRAGDMWLVTLEQSDTHIADVHEKYIEDVKLTVLSSRQYCVVKNPKNEKGETQYGHL